LHQRLAEAGFDDQRPSDDAAFAHIPPEGIRLTDLARRAGVSKQAMAEVVASLESRGYVERTPDPTDGRARLIRFSQRGWASVDVALDALEAAEQDLRAELGDRTLKQLRATLARIVESRPSAPDTDP
jgi:DNA-binding MarR family transcriptional regulator